MTGAVITPLDRRQAWLDDRKTKITGTDAAKILGFSKFGGPMDVYLVKTGQASDEIAKSNAIDAGRRLERPIIEWYADNEGIEINWEDSHTLHKSPVHTRIGATLDATRVTGEPIDAKNIRWCTPEWGKAGSDDMPLYYASQLVWQMHVTDKPFADLAVLFSGQDLTIYRLHRDLQLEQNMIGQCLDWWTRHIEADVPPPVDGSPSYTKYLQEKVRQTTESIITATPELHEKARLLNEVREHIESFEQEKEYYQNLIKTEIGEGKKLIGANWSASWTQAKDSMKTDWEAVALACNPPAELVGQHTVTKPGSRRFLFTYKGDA